MNQSRSFLLVVCVLSLLLVPVYGQKTDGTIQGVVTDPAGAVVPNAPVTVSNTATGQTRSTSTDSGGYYTVPQLPPGQYEVVVKAASFKESRTRSVEVHVASSTTVDVQLVVGSASEQVEVSANAIQVETGSAALGEVIDSSQVSELPLNGRSFVQLTQLSPGVSGANNFDSKNKGLQGGVDFSVNGNPTTNNLFLIDGANNNDVGSNRTILLYPSNEAIAEFKMMRNAYGAEYGQASGAVINILTKGGTNQFHGSALYFGRNDALSTFEYFAAQSGTGQKDVLRRNDWGYSFGGPIKKDKLFFFWSQEWNHEKRGLTRTSCVPTADERAGDFSADALLANGSTNCANGIKDSGAQTPAIPLAFQDPANAHKILNPSPAGMLLIAKYPLPNITPATVGGNNWALSESSKLLWREENGRVDFNLTKSQSLMFRYTQDHWENPAPTGGVYWGDDFFPGLTGSWAQPSKQIVGKWTSLLGSSTVNEVEFAYSNNRINIGVGGSNPGLQQQISSAIGPLYPEALKTAPASVPTIWGGFSSYGSGQNYWVIAPWQNQLDIYTVRDDLSKVIGNHTLKVGAFLGWNEKDEDNGASSTERPTFGTANWDTNQPTNNNLANVLIPGAVWGLSENSTNVRDLLKWRDYEFYVGDNWKIRRNVTVDVGVRYSLMLTPFQPQGNFTNFVPSLYDPTKPASDACNGLWIVPGTDPCGAANKLFGTTYSKGVNGPNKYLRNQNYHLFAPRLGIAWDPRGDSKTAVRFGIGQFYQRERVSPNNGLAANAPFSVNGNLSRALDATTQIASGGNASPTAGANPTSNVPSSWQWNVSIQHQFARDTALEIGYVGNRAMHLTSRYDINAIDPNGTAATCHTGDGVNYTNIPNWTCAAFLSSNPPGGAQNINTLRRYSNFGAINFFDRGGDATYHSLQMLFKTKYKRSALTAAYTWSHSISDVQLDDSSGGANSANYLDYARPSLDRGNSPINRPHIFVANAYFYLPELKGANAFERNALGGWELATILTAASGNSHTVFQNGISDVNGAGHLSSLIGTGYVEPQRPLLTGQSCDSGRSGNLLYNPGAFTLVGYQIGSLPSNLEPRGFCPGPHLVNTDFSVDKNWKLTERFNMRFALDFFNLFNHPNFRGDQVKGYTPDQKVACGTTACSPINNVITAEIPTTDFGKSSQTTNKAGREVQYSLKITF